MLVSLKEQLTECPCTWELIMFVLSFQIFCSRCSSHSAPLPRYGQMKPVRVCTHCYMFHVTPFYSDKAGI